MVIIKTSIPDSVVYGLVGIVSLLISENFSFLKFHNIVAAFELDSLKGAVYRSIDRGSTWHKQSNTVSRATGPHYYQELYTSPHKFDRLYLMDTGIQISENGGKTFKRLKDKYKHVDNHAIAFRNDDPKYLLVGTDGGLYESFDNSFSNVFDGELISPVL